MAAPAYRSSASTAGSATTSISIAAPAGLANNDIIIAVLYTEPATAVITVATGFTALVSWAGTGFRTSIYWKRAASESGAYGFTSGTATWMGGIISAHSGALITGNPFNAQGTGSTGSSASPQAAAITTTVDQCELLYVSQNFGGSLNTPPSGMTERIDVTAGTIADVTQTTAGSTGAKTGAITSAAWTAVLLALAPIAVITRPMISRQAVKRASFY